MQQFILFAVLSSTAFVAAKVSLNAKLHEENLLELHLDDAAWIANTDVWLMYKGKKLSYKDGTLKLKVNLTEHGYDPIGNWTERIYGFVPAEMPQIIVMETAIRMYQGLNIILMDQTFPIGSLNTSVGDKNKVCTGFPNFVVNPELDLGFLAYGGIMFGETNRKVGRWNTDSGSIASGLDSGPLVLFNKQGQAVVLSSISNVMAGSTVYEKMGSKMTMTFGLLGMAEEIPKLFSYAMIAVVDDGINRAMDRWGEFMRYAKHKPRHFREADFVNNYIGYWTDNGAYYYYETETNKTYETTILDVYDYAKKEGIPYRYVQYDSWFYPKGPDNGVTEWVPMKSIFPHGLQYVWNKTGWANIAHNRWWSSKTGYAKANGGKWNFIVENSTLHAIPVDSGFWDYLMRTSKEWGLLTYEQDWLNVEFESLHATQSDLRLGRLWLKQMGRGAERNGLTIQYCMAPSRCALQSLEIPAVTQARVSDDYLVTKDQWKIGMSSMLADNLEIAPFKDNFWTTTTQPGNKYGKTEPYPQLQSVVATMSTGPVGPSDKIGCSNVTLIMKSCNSDGLILKPTRPARSVDMQLIETAYNGFKGEVWSTYSIIDRPPFAFGIIFGADFNESITITPDQAGYGELFPKSKVYSAWDSSKLMDISNTAPLKMSNCSKSNFCLYHTSPVFMLGDTEVVLLGELSKWIPMSHKRVTFIGIEEYDIEVVVTGGVDERISFSYYYNQKLYTVPCILSSSGTAVVSVASMKCIPE